MGCGEECAVSAHGKHQVRFRLDIVLRMNLVYLKGGLLQVLQEREHAGIGPELISENEIPYFHDSL